MDSTPDPHQVRTAPGTSSSASDDGSSSCADSPLFTFPTRGAFKRKRDSNDEGSDDDSDGSEGKKGGGKDKGDNDDGSDSDGDGAFSSSPEMNQVRRRGAENTNRRLPGDDSDSRFLRLLGDNSDDEGLGVAALLPPRTTATSTTSLLSTAIASSTAAPSSMVASSCGEIGLTKHSKRPRGGGRASAMDEAALQAKAEALIEESLRGENSGFSAGVSPRGAAAADRDFNRSIKERLAAASTIDLPSKTTPPHILTAIAAQQAATATSASNFASFSSTPSNSASSFRAQRDLAGKRVKLRVVRSKTQQHIFKTKLGKEVGVIEDGCRGQVALVSREEGNAGISLYHEDTLLESSKTLADTGITGDATLRLEVTGEKVLFTGPPIAIKVQTQGKKTFTVEMTTDMKFSEFMERFGTAVGIPINRASECRFELDGDKINPDGTPEDDDLESGDLIDAKLPSDLMVGVQQAPSNLNLVACPRNTKQQAGGGGGGRSSGTAAAAASAAAAVPLGRGGGGSSSRYPASRAATMSTSARSTRCRTRKSGSGSGGGGGSSAAGEVDDVIILD